MVFRGGDNVLVSELDGFIIGVPGEEWRMAAYHAFRGPLEPGLLSAFQRVVKPGMVVLDIGANIGVFTLHAARLVGLHGKVYSFEPAPRVFKILKENVQVNGFLETGVIEFRQVAAWDRAGIAQMTVYEADSGRSTLFPSDGQGREIEVTTATLDEALSAQQRVDVVKIDAEGAEPRILRGMRRIIERNPEIVIFIEFAPVHLRRAGVEPTALLDEIGSLGLAIRQVDDVTGELLPINRDRIAACFSANLSLSRIAA
jgi:FkbM family methyltransferase